MDEVFLMLNFAAILCSAGYLYMVLGERNPIITIVTGVVSCVIWYTVAMAAPILGDIGIVAAYLYDAFILIELLIALWVASNMYREKARGWW